MNEDAGGCLIVAVLAVSLVVAVSLCLLRDNYESYKKGYVQALADIESKRPLMYKRVKQKNGETIWIKNEEKENEK